MDCQITFPPNASEQPIEVRPILSRREAKARLSKLKPETEEYRKLEGVLLKAGGIMEINLPHTTYKVNTFSHNCKLMGGFGSSEHVAIGKEVKLQGLPDKAALLVKGVTDIRFEHIVALAGDFYGVVGGAVSLPGGSDEEKTERFMQAYETLANADNYQIQKIVQEIGFECEAVENSSLPHHCYSNQMIERNKRMKKIKNDIDELLLDNSDHFSTNAKEAYRIGHACAMNRAAEAGKNSDLEGLKQAYALDAFACHFLTDLFAAGHIRNQRGELELFLISQLGFSSQYAKPLAGILTGAQHEQDGNAGLNVFNDEGDHWRAYGDGNFFAPKNSDNRAKAIAATQQSVNEIHNAYLNPNNPTFVSIVGQLIPSPTFFNPPPIYSIEGNSLFLIEGNIKTEIQSKADYLTKGIAQALRYLPQEYIDGVLTLFPEIHPVIDKVIVPQLERITGTLWHMVGIATYHQVKKEFDQTNQKINEMADVLLAIYRTSLKILEQIKIVDSKVNDLLWANTFAPLQSSIDTINNIAHQYKSYTLDEAQQNQAKIGLWDALNQMSSLFLNGTADGQNILIAYQKKLQGSEMSTQEVQLATTLWFRQMLSYQVQAFSLYLTLQFLRNNPNENQVLRNQALEFECVVKRQIEHNKDNIDPILICQSEGYVLLQLEKGKTRRLAVQLLEQK